MVGISGNNLFQASPFSKGKIMGSVLKVLLELWFACNMCQCFVRIFFKFGNAQLYVTDNGVYHDVFVDGAVVFDQVGKLSKSAVWQHLFCILY